MKRAIGLVRRVAGAALSRQGDGRRTTYCSDPPAGGLQQLIGGVPLVPLRAASAWIVPAADLYCRNRFDLLGSGWLEIAHGMACNGLDGHRHPPAPAVEADHDGNWLEGRVNSANLATSQRVARLAELTRPSNQ